MMVQKKFWIPKIWSKFFWVTFDKDFGSPSLREGGGLKSLASDKPTYQIWASKLGLDPLKSSCGLYSTIFILPRLLLCWCCG